MAYDFKHKGMPQGSALYFFAWLGATIYYLQHATGFWMGVLGVLKAFVWPVFLMLRVYDFLKM